MTKQLALMLIALLPCASALCTEIVVIVNLAAEPPTRAQVSDIYLGKSQSSTPLDQSEASSIRAEFYLRSTGRDLAQVKMAWSRIVFTGRGQPPRELPSSQAMKRAVAADPKAIGYIDKADVDSTVKAALTLN